MKRVLINALKSSFLGLIILSGYFFVCFLTFIVLNAIFGLFAGLFGMFFVTLFAAMIAQELGI